MDKQKAIAELGITEDVYDELVKDFIIQTDEFIKRMEKASEKDDFGEIVKLSHSIKGLAGSLRIQEIQNVAEDIEQAGKKNRGKEIIEKNIKLLKAALGKLKDAG